MLNKLKNRRSFYPQEFVPGDIPQDHLREILDTARYAPTHRKTEPWRFKVLTGETKCDCGQFLADAYDKSVGKENSFKAKKLLAKFDQSAAVILIFMYRDEKERLPEWEEIAATSMAMQNVWLAATEKGYGGYWSSPKSFADMRDFGSLNIHERERFLGFFFLGKVNGTTKELPARKPLDEVVQWL